MVCTLRPRFRRRRRPRTIDAMDGTWVELGVVEDLRRRPLQQITVGRRAVRRRSTPGIRSIVRPGCQFPQFPYVAYSRGWSAEDMEENVSYVREHEELHDGTRALVDRAVDLAERLIATAPVPSDHRAGRKASGFLSARPSLPVVVGEE